MEKRKLLTVVCSVGLVLLLSSFLFMTACSKPAQKPPSSEVETLSIGYLVSLTGFISVWEIPDMEQAKIVADIINEDGGISINGQRYLIDLILEDYKSSMDGTTAAANKLVYDKGVKFIVGPTAFFSAGAGPVTDPAKVIRVLTWCTNTPGQLDASTPYAFLGTNAAVANVMGCSKFLKKNYPSVKKVVIVTPEDNIPIMVDIAEKILEADGFTIVGGTVGYSNEMQDFSPIVAKLNAVKEADAIFQVCGIAPHTGFIAKGLREQGNNKPYAAAEGVSLRDVVNIAGAEACKDLFICGINPNDPKLPPLAKEICDRTIAKYGETHQLSLCGADSLWVLKEVIEAANSLDPTVVKSKWESMDTVETPFGTGIICGDETFGIKHHVVAHPQCIEILKDGVVAPGGIMDIGAIP